MADQPEPSAKVYYRIRNWDEEFENNQSRQLKELPWVRMKIVVRSEEFLWLLDHPNGAAHLGIWYALIQIAARCNPRGSLLKFDGTPHDFPSVTKLLNPGLQDTVIEACTRLQVVGWLECVSFSSHAFKGLKPSVVKSEIAPHRNPDRNSGLHKGDGSLKPRDARARDGRGEENLSTPTPPFSKEGRAGSRNGTGKLKRSERLALEYAAEVEARKRKEKQNDV